MRRKLVEQRLHGTLRKATFSAENGGNSQSGEHRNQKAQGRAGFGAVTKNGGRKILLQIGRKKSFDKNTVLPKFHKSSGSLQNAGGSENILRNGTMGNQSAAV